MSAVSKFKDIFNNETKILILWTVPWNESLKNNEYYSSPKNSFWDIIWYVLEIDNFKEKDYNSKIELLLKHNIWLSDVISKANRKENSSLDSDIYDVQTHNLINLIRQLPNLKVIVFNWKKAYEIFTKEYPNFNKEFPNIELISLPSTSNSNARITKIEKSKEWKKYLSPFLE